GMSDNEIQGVKTAALLHDIGKLAVPEHILSKPGPLTQEEFQKVRIHPQVGAEIISGVPFPYPVAPLILSHHERWDGKGYPAGLKGEEIPLGARILSVVDYFDALMSERPYHKAMSLDDATGLLRQEMGKALDPRVVETFIDMYTTLAGEAEASQEPSRKLTRVPMHAPTGSPAGWRATGGRSSTRGRAPTWKPPASRPTARPCSRRSSARCSSTSGSSARFRCTTPSRQSTATTIAACSTVSRSRPPRSSTTRSCSSRPRKIHSPMR